jgi:biopolymer transport protein TolR
MGGSVAKSGRRRGMVEINMTPLVDVMLVLLVVFMVAAPLLASGVPLKLPQVSTSASPLEAKPVVLSVTLDGHLFFGEKEVTGDLKSALKTEPRLLQGTPLYVRADKDARYGVVARAMAEAREAGVSNVTLLVEADGKP